MNSKPSTSDDSACPNPGMRHCEHPICYRVPTGLGSVQMNVVRGLFGLAEKSVQRLHVVTDIREEPVVRAVALPVLSDWQRPGVDQEVHRLQPVMATLIGSLGDTPANDADQSARISAVRKFIRRNSRNAALDVDSVAQYPHRLFDAIGSRGGCVPRRVNRMREVSHDC
jgi:hypothetical protein